MHSVEVWDGEELVGGLYGGAMGNNFFTVIHPVHQLASKYEFIN